MFIHSCRFELELLGDRLPDTRGYSLLVTWLLSWLVQPYGSCSVACASQRVAMSTNEKLLKIECGNQYCFRSEPLSEIFAWIAPGSCEFRHRENFWTFTGPEDRWPHEKSKFYWSSKTFAGSHFFSNIKVTIEGLLQIFFTGQEDRDNNSFHWSSTVFTSRGPRTGGFPSVCEYMAFFVIRLWQWCFSLTHLFAVSEIPSPIACWPASRALGPSQPDDKVPV